MATRTPTVDDLLTLAEQAREAGDRAGARELLDRALGLRVREADEAVVAAEAALERAQARRQQAMEDARDRGWSYQRISDHSSVSQSRVVQLLRGDPS